MWDCKGASGIETGDLLKLWEMTVGADADFSALSADESYKPSFELRAAASPPPKRADPFVTADLIGRGGIGEIFRARQVGLERDVALKRLRPEKAKSEQARSNFIAEAVVTGRLEHPNIVPIYSLGASSDGNAFLAMKLVGGQSWKSLLHEGQTRGLLEHLDILIQVCNAVAFAHSHQIVHNDLKPANVMVGRFGEVLVLDWGLAVDFHPEGPREDLVRHRDEIKSPLGTPHYMPPELALGQGRSIGPWTDVYLLGAILCEILTGSPPNRGASLIQVLNSAIFGEQRGYPADVPAELREICERALCIDPRDRHPTVTALQQDLRAYLSHKESQTITENARRELERCRQRSGGRLSESDINLLYDGFAEAVAGFRQARRLWAENPSATDGELEARRAYARAALVQGDLSLAEAQAAQLDDTLPETRELHEQIHNERQSRLQAQKSARRLKRYLGVTLACLLVGLSVGLVLLWIINSHIREQNSEILEQNAEIEAKNREIEAQNHEILEQQNYAQRRGEIAEAALNAMISEVQTRLLVRSDRAAQDVARRVLEVATSGWEQLRAADIAEERVSRATAMASLRIGELKLDARVELDSALVAFEAAQTTLRRLAAESPSDAAAKRDLYVALLHVADVRNRLGETQRARSIFEQATGIARRLKELRPADPQARADLSFVLEKLGKTLLATGELEAGRQAFAEAVAIDRALLADFGGVEDRLNLASSLGDLADAWQRTGDLDAALQAAEQSVELCREVRARDDFSVDPEPALALALAGLGNVAMVRGDSARARRCLLEAVELERSVLQRDPDNARLLRRLAAALGAMGDFLLYIDLPPEALVYLEESLQLCQRLAAAAPDDAAAVTLLSEGQSSVAAVALLRGDLARSEQLFLANLATLRGLIELDPRNLEHVRSLSNGLHNYAKLLLHLQRDALAVATFEQSLEILRGLHETSPTDIGVANDLGLALTNLGVLLLELGHPEAALDLHSEAQELLARGMQSDRANQECAYILGVCLANLGDTAAALERWPLAETRTLEGIALLRQVVAADSGHLRARQRLAQTTRDWGALLLQTLGQAEAALPYYLESLELWRELKLPQEVCYALQHLGAARQALGRVDAAAADFRAAAEQARLASLAESQRLAIELPCWQRLVDLLAGAGRLEEADQAFARAIELCRRFVALDTGAAGREQLVLLLADCAAFRAPRDPALSQSQLEEAWQLQRRAVTQTSPETAPELLLCELAGQLAFLYSQRQDVEGLDQRSQALEVLSEARTALARLRDAAPEDADTRQELLRAHNSLAVGHFLFEELDTSLKLWRLLAEQLQALGSVDEASVRAVQLATELLLQLAEGFATQALDDRSAECRTLAEQLRLALDKRALP